TLACPSSRTPTQSPVAVNFFDPLRTSMPTRAPVTASSLIVTSSASTLRPKPPLGPLTPAQGPPNPDSVVQVPPWVATSSSVIGGKLAPRGIVSEIWPSKAGPNPIVSPATVKSASWIAARSEQLAGTAVSQPRPSTDLSGSSDVVLTVNEAARE